jgi:hypothetical protein
MLTCRSLDLRHPGLVALDSPLVTFRDSDANDELLTDTQTKIAVRDAFYRDLVKCPKDCQIIIMENEDPPDDLVESISYHHFSRLPSLGRRGFRRDGNAEGAKRLANLRPFVGRFPKMGIAQK